MGRTFLRLLNVDLGFHPARVVTLNVSIQGTRHSGSGEWQNYSEALHRLRSVPGVKAAGAVSYLPLTNDVYMADAFKLDSGLRVERIVMNAVMPGYFSAMGTSFLAGHDFAENEKEHSEPSVIVNEAFAKSAGLGRTIVGRKLTPSGGNTPYLIAGVVTTARCRDAVRSVDPEVPVYDVKTLDQRLTEVLSRPRFYTTATLFMTLLAALLAAVGSYGTAAYSIAQRKHEMGIRIALGASYHGVRGMMLRESLIPIIVGAVSGIFLSLALGRYLGHLLENAVQPTVWTCAAGAALLLLTGLTAAWSATGRVLSIDPADALRAE